MTFWRLAWRRGEDNGGIKIVLLTPLDRYTHDKRSHTSWVDHGNMAEIHDIIQTVQICDGRSVRLYLAELADPCGAGPRPSLLFPPSRGFHTLPFQGRHEMGWHEKGRHEMVPSQCVPLRPPISLSHASSIVPAQEGSMRKV